MKKCTLVLGLVGVAGLVGFTTWHRQTAVRSRAEAAQLQVENSELRRLAAAALEAQRAAEKTSDGLRIAAEIGERVRTTPSVEPQPHVTTATLSATPSFAPARATPTAAARTVHAAINGGDPHAMAETIVLQAKGAKLAADVFERLAPGQKVRYGNAERLLAELLCATTPSANVEPNIVAETAGARGMEPTLSTDLNYMTVQFQSQKADGTTRDSYQVYQRTTDGWRWVVSDGLVLKRLVETGLMPAPTTGALGK